MTLEIGTINSILMRTFFLPLIFIFVLPCEAAIQIKNISFRDAIKAELISYSANYVLGNNHQRILLRISNNSNVPLRVGVEPGSYFKAEKNNWQDHVITWGDSILVMPFKDSTQSFVAYCCQRGNSAPYENSILTFIPEDKSPKGISQLCRLLNEMNDNTYISQSSLWALCSNTSPNEICGIDSLYVMKARQLVGGILNKPYAAYNSHEYVIERHLRIPAPIEFHNNGTLKVNDIKANDKIEIAMYDMNEHERAKAKIAYESILVQELSLCRFLYNIYIPTVEPHSQFIIRVLKNDAVYQEWLYQT